MIGFNLKTRICILLGLDREAADSVVLSAVESKIAAATAIRQRDEFAASTLSGLASRWTDANYIARQAYHIADAMIALRKPNG